MTSSTLIALMTDVWPEQSHYPKSLARKSTRNHQLPWALMSFVPEDKSPAELMNQIQNTNTEKHILPLANYWATRVRSFFWVIVGKRSFCVPIGMRIPKLVFEYYRWFQCVAPKKKDWSVCWSIFSPRCGALALRDSRNAKEDFLFFKFGPKQIWK